MKLKFNTKYKYDKVSGFHFNKPSLTDQSQAYVSDINNIVKGACVMPTEAKEPVFGMTFSPDQYQESLNIIATAHSEFEKLPAHVRREFDDKPENLVKFFDNPTKENCEKGVKLGLYKKEILNQFYTKNDGTKPMLEPSQGDNITEASSQ